MKKSNFKKSQKDQLDSNTFLNTVLPNIKINQKSYPLSDFPSTPSKEEKTIKKPSSINQV